MSQAATDRAGALRLLSLSPETPVETIPALRDVADERVRQVAQGFDAPADDLRDPDDWLGLVVRQVDRASRCVGEAGSLIDPGAYRGDLVVIAALAIAAIEALDRRPEAASDGGASTDPLAGRPSLETDWNPDQPFTAALRELVKGRGLHGAVLISFYGDRVGANSSGRDDRWGSEMKRLADQVLARIDDGDFDPAP